MTVTGSLPGEQSGPGIELTIEITNQSQGPIDLNAVTVDLTDAADVSASPIEPPEPIALAGELSVGGSTTGRYQFTLPLEDRDDATVRVSYSADAPTVLFTGNLPDA